MEEPTECPICFTDLRGAAKRDDVGYYTYAYPYKIEALYDGPLIWECPNCEGRFHLLSPDSELWFQAQYYVSKAIR